MLAATLFSGIGAPEVAMPHWDWLWHAEIEKFPSAVMAARHPKSINLGDVTAHDFTQRAEAIGRPDVLVFGSPCQSFSVAGKRLGLDDPRGNLALTALGIVDRLKPSWFVFENVPGLFSSYSGAEQAEGALRDRAERGTRQIGETVDVEEDRDLAAFLSRVQDIGYSGAWAVLDAQYRGVAQRRERVFFVGNPRDWRHSAAILLEPTSLCGDHPPRRKAGQDAALPLSTRVDRGGSHREAHGNNLIAKALNAKGGSGRIDGERETFVAHALRGEGFDASKDGTGRGTPLIVNNTGQGWWNESDVASPLRNSVAGGKEATLVAFAFGSHAGTAEGDQTNRSHSAGGPVGFGISEELSYSLRGGRTQAVALFDERNVTSKANRAACRPDVAPMMHAEPFALAFSSKDYGADAQVELSPTLRAGGHDGSHANAGVPPAVLHAGVRRLTPRECERLQSFADDYTLIRYPTHSAKTGKPLKRPRWAADGPRYKACGNSMNVEVIRWILNRIEIFETQIRPLIEKSA